MYTLVLLFFFFQETKLFFISKALPCIESFPSGSEVKNLFAMQEMRETGV